MRADPFDSRAPSQLGSPRTRESAALQVEGVDKRFGRKEVLRGIDLNVWPEEVVGLVGENGCGKTTLLRICAGLVAPDQGTVRVSGRLGYCPQQPGLFDRLTADEHLAYFGAGRGLTRAEAVAEGRRVLGSFGFPAWERSVAGQLSGGTRQKLNLALALLGHPTVLLLDEPYQGFDHGVYVNFWDHVDSWRRTGQAILVVTHMLAEQDRVDRVVDLSMARGDGAG